MRDDGVFSDGRLAVGCAYCGQAEELTEDHAPARVFLDKPYGDEAVLPAVWACSSCNAGMSLDEEYVACLIECALSGSADPDRVTRARVREALLHSRKSAAGRSLVRRLEEARHERDGRTYFHVEAERVRRVLVKFARAHAVWDRSAQFLEEPATFRIVVLPELAAPERREFEALPDGEVSSRVLSWPELGTRAFLRSVVAFSDTGSGVYSGNEWIAVQEGRYRFAVADAGERTLVRIVLSEYVGCEVLWAD